MSLQKFINELQTSDLNQTTLDNIWLKLHQSLDDLNNITLNIQELLYLLHHDHSFDLNDSNFLILILEILETTYLNSDERMFF